MDLTFAIDVISSYYISFNFKFIVDNYISTIKFEAFFREEYIQLLEDIINNISNLKQENIIYELDHNDYDCGGSFKINGSNFIILGKSRGTEASISIPINDISKLMLIETFNQIIMEIKLNYL